MQIQQLSLHDPHHRISFFVSDPDPMVLEWSSRPTIFKQQIYHSFPKFREDRGAFYWAYDPIDRSSILLSLRPKEAIEFKLRWYDSFTKE